MVLGSMTRLGAKVHLSARAVKLQGAGVVAAEQVDVPLDADLAALFGDVAPAVAPGRELSRQDLAAAAERRQRDEAPVTVAATPYRLRLYVNGQLAPVRQGSGNLWVGLKPGDRYEVELLNMTDRRVAVALHIDGLNTVYAKPELPSDGLKWVLEPRTSARIRGWQTDGNTLKEFLVVGLPDSVAARQQFTEQVGLITASFYPEDTEEYRGLDVPRGIATGEGQAHDSKLTEVPFVPTARPAAILSLHYDRAEAVEGYPVVG
jgi:hypothetical protein